MNNYSEEKSLLDVAESSLVDNAIKYGFHAAAFISVDELEIKPEYRNYCEMNLCHCYNANPSCPPKCGTVEEMTAKLMKYKRVLVLQTEYEADFKDDAIGAYKTAMEHNELVDRFIEKQWNYDGEMLRMSAGPYKNYSCMSAYCVDVDSAARKAGMVCWMNDGKCRLFTFLIK